VFSVVSIARNQRRERICSLFSIDTESSKLRVAGSSPAAPTMFSIGATAQVLDPTGGAGGTRSTGIADLAWRDYNLRKTSQDFHTERTEKEKPLPRVDHESRHLANDQKANLTPSCTRRPSRLAIYCPKRAFTCLPVASNRATVSTLVPVPFAPPN